MLNLVELGSNYPLFLLLCLKRACSSFQDKSPDFDRKEDISSGFKKDSRFEEARGSRETKQSKTADNMRKTGEHTEGQKDARPCTQTRAQPAGQYLARPGRAGWHDRARQGCVGPGRFRSSSRFLAFFIRGFPSFFGTSPWLF